MAESISYTLEDGVAILHMDDGKANALSHELMDAFNLLLDRAESEAAAVVLAGREGRFSAGFDLKVMMSGPEAVKGLLKKGADLLMRLFGLPLPLVIAAGGHALAGGALLVLTGDQRFVAEGPFKIGLNEVTIGMPVPILAMELARARLLPTELTSATLLGRIYSPSEALRAGYVDRVVPAADLLGEAKQEAKRLSEISKFALAATKKRLRGATIELIHSTFERDVLELTPS